MCVKEKGVYKRRMCNVVAASAQFSVVLTHKQNSLVEWKSTQRLLRAQGASLKDGPLFSDRSSAGLDRMINSMHLLKA